MERIKFELDVPQDIKLIHKVFNDNGFQLFIVGGSIRDAILGQKPKDWDLTSEVIPSKVIEMFKDEGFVKNILLIGESFGVVSLVTENDTFEIATFRSDGEYTNNRHPDSVTFGTIVEDSKRRDLTCNALFFDLDTSEIVDLVGGVEDLKNGIIRTVGNAEDRFREDRLRILRAIRFAARFSNGLDSGIIDALSNDSSLEGISSERIRDEFLKGLKSAKSSIFFFEMLDSFNLFDWIFPNLVVNKDFKEDKDPILQLAILLKDNDPFVLSKMLNKLTFSIVENKGITFLVSLQGFRSVDDMFKFKKSHINSGVDNTQICKFALIFNLNATLIVNFTRFELTIKGEDIMSEFGLTGKDLGDKIKELETERFKKLCF